jgi:hypothetical protein
MIIDEAKLLDKQERRTTGYGAPIGLSMTKREPPPRKQKLSDQRGKGKMNAVIRITKRYPHPSKSQAQAVRDADAAEEPPKRRIIQAAEKWQVPDDTSTMINQICFAHRRLEHLLTRFTKKVGSKFIKTMDDEFQKIQQETTLKFNQGLREK